MQKLLRLAINQLIHSYIYRPVANNGAFLKLLTMAKSTARPPLAIGIDIGGTGTKFGIVDRDGNVLFNGENPISLR